MVALLLVAGLLSPPAAADEGSGGSSGTVSTHVEVANALPENIRWDVAHEQYLGFYTFNVSAADNNGVDDLDRLVLLLTDADGVETRHETDEGQRLNATTALWRGQVWAEERPIATPVQVQVEVQDRAGEATVENGQGRPLIPWPWRAPRTPETPVDPGEGDLRPGGALDKDPRTGQGASSTGKGPASALEPLYVSAARIHEGWLGTGTHPGWDSPWLHWGLFTGLVSALLLVVVARRPSEPRDSGGSPSSGAPAWLAYAIEDDSGEPFDARWAAGFAPRQKASTGPVGPEGRPRRAPRGPSRPERTRPNRGR